MLKNQASTPSYNSSLIYYANWEMHLLALFLFLLLVPRWYRQRVTLASNTCNGVYNAVVVGQKRGLKLVFPFPLESCRITYDFCDQAFCFIYNYIPVRLQNDVKWVLVYCTMYEFFDFLTFYVTCIFVIWTIVILFLVFNVYVIV